MSSLNGNDLSVKGKAKLDSFHYSSPMQRFFTQIIQLIFFALLATKVNALNLISIDRESVIVCPAQAGKQSNSKSLPIFSENHCQTIHAAQIDPQNTALWVKAKLTIPEEMLADIQTNAQPYSVYIFGKTSSEVYFNGEYIGQNGHVSLAARDEFPGKIDARFYVPGNLIKGKNNELVLFLSSHHGFLELNNPLSFIGFGAYADPSYFIQQHYWLSFIPLGALIIGALYFLVASFNPEKRRSNLLLLFMSLLAAGQLLIEISRSLVAYSYPFHDLRLLMITSLAFLFGVCLLTYVSLKFSNTNKLTWIGTGAILSLIGIIFTPGFDGKTAVAILIPTLMSMIFIGLQASKIKSKSTWGYFILFLTFTLTILVTFNRFHDIIFYYLISGMLGFLLMQNALEFSREQTRRKLQEQIVAKLQFKLEQNEQQQTPQNIKVNSAGKIEVIPSNLITYCQAAGDYAEIYKEDKKPILYSGNLKELENQLPSTFLRVHRSFIVNIDFISSLKSSNGGEKKLSLENVTTNTVNTIKSNNYLLLINGEQVPVSRRIMPMVRKAINEV